MSKWANGQMGRPGDVALMVLAVLICGAPIFGMVGVPWEWVGGAVGWWVFWFVVIAALNRRYDESEG